MTAGGVVVAAARFEPGHRVGHERVDGAGRLGPGEDADGLLVEAGDGVIVGDIEMDLDAARQGHIGRAAGQEVALVEGPGVEGVVGEDGVDGLERAVGSAGAAEQRCAKHPRPRVPGVRRERALQGLECPVEVAATRSNGRTGRLGCRLPAAVPGRLAERVLGLVESVGHAERHAEQVEGLALGGVRVSSGERRNRATEVALRVGELAAAEVPRAKCRVAATVPGLAPDSLAPVGLRRARRVAVLLEVAADQEQLFDRGDLVGRWRLGRRRRWLAVLDASRAIGDHERAVRGEDPQLEVVRCAAVERHVDA